MKTTLLLLILAVLASAQKKTTSSPPPPPPKPVARPVQPPRPPVNRLPQQPVTRTPQQPVYRPLQPPVNRIPNVYRPTVPSRPIDTYNRPMVTPNRPAFTGPSPHAFDSRPMPAGLRHETRAGGEMTYRANNTPRDFRRGDFSIHHSLNGSSRRLEYEGSDHLRIVAEHGGRGYIQRPYQFQSRDGKVYELGHRTYVTPSGRIVDRFYGRHFYHGVYVNYYVPAVYFRPGFYVWAYNPWAVPVPYAWGWMGSPWATYYGYYFAPYPVYPSAAAWITDYMISTTLAASYQNALAAQQAPAMSGPPPVGASPLTPEVKDLVSQEVRRQLELENYQSRNLQGVPDPVAGSIEMTLRDDIKHVFLVEHSLDVPTLSGGECTVSQGDALQLAGPPPADSPTANLIVLSSKGGVECRRQDIVQVQIGDLQEMVNAMRERLNAAELQLQTKQGTGGLPQIPSLARGTAPQPDYVVSAPQPDQNAAAELALQYNSALKLEDQVASGPSAGASTMAVDLPPVPTQQVSPTPPNLRKIDVGETEEEVEAAYVPEIAANFDLKNGKTLLVYKDQRVFLQDGKVIQVQKL